MLCKVAFLTWIAALGSILTQESLWMVDRYHMFMIDWQSVDHFSSSL